MNNNALGGRRREICIGIDGAGWSRGPVEGISIHLKTSRRNTQEKIVHIAIVVEMTASLVDVRESKIITTRHTWREESSKDVDLRHIEGSIMHVGAGDSDWSSLAIEAEGIETSGIDETKNSTKSTNIIVFLRKNGSHLEGGEELIMGEGHLFGLNFSGGETSKRTEKT